jgi:hypothetical protein
MTTASDITMKFSDNGDKITLVGYNGTSITPPVEMVTKVNNRFVAADENSINAAVKNIISPPANVATSVAVNSGVTLGGATRRTVRRRTVRRRPMKKGGKKYQSKSIRRK